MLYKLDRGGEGQQICREDFSKNKGLSFIGFTDEMFLEVCQKPDISNTAAFLWCFCGGMSEAL